MQWKQQEVGENQFAVHTILQRFLNLGSVVDLGLTFFFFFFFQVDTVACWQLELCGTVTGLQLEVFLLRKRIVHHGKQMKAFLGLVISTKTHSLLYACS